MCDGSRTDIRRKSTNVCFTPKSGHWDTPTKCPLCAKSGVMHCSKLLLKFRNLRIIPAAVAEKIPASKPLFVYFAQSFGGSALRHRVWQIFFGRKRRTDPRVSEIRHPVRSDFHTVVTKTGLSCSLGQVALPTEAIRR